MAVLRGAAEAIVLFLVCLAPWGMGARHPLFVLILFAGVAMLLLLWAIDMLLEKKPTWQKCPVILCLAGLLLLGIWQLAPLPRPFLELLSPATAVVYERYLPGQAEVLPSGSERLAAVFPAGSTISLNPAATAKDLVELLAVLLLFAAVRNHYASAASLARLSVAAVINGAALSLLGLVQFYTSPVDTAYWKLHFPGTALFGPLGRNHFPFYVNMCIGLGIGLLLATYASPRRGNHSDPDEDTWFRSALGLLKDQRRPWIVCALALMLAGVVFSQGRGGFLTLVGAAFICFLLKMARDGRLPRLGTALVVLTLTLALISWLGFDWGRSRLATIPTASFVEDGRLKVWLRALPLLKDFPIWGTGYGTFGYVETTLRTSAENEEMFFYRSYNGYLDAAVEGGLIRLGLSLLAIGLVFKLGYRALGRHGSAGALALGALFSFSTVVIHSFFDLGIHFPAFAMLITVICAHLCALGKLERGDGPETGGAAGGEYVPRLWGLAPALGAATAILLGLALVAEGWRAFRVHKLMLAASRLNEGAGPVNRELQIAYIGEAARLAPENPWLHIEKADAHLFLIEEQGAARERELASFSLAAQAILACAARPVPQAVSGLAVTLAGREVLPNRLPTVFQEHQAAALQHYLCARDLCPILSKPQLALAMNADKLTRAEAASAYLERAKLLTPYAPRLWYLCGLKEFRDGQLDAACQSWRRCLELSDKYLPEILETSSKHLGPRQVLDLVLPDEPAIVYEASVRLFPEPAAAAERRPFHEKALALLGKKPAPRHADDLYLQGLLHTSLGQLDEAVRAYRSALAQEPRQASWRCQLAQALHERGELHEARRQLLIVIQQQPGNGPARELLATLERELGNKD